MSQKPLSYRLWCAVFAVGRPLSVLLLLVLGRRERLGEVGADGGKDHSQEEEEELKAHLGAGEL